MGNEQSCCPQNQNNEPTIINITTKSSHSNQLLKTSSINQNNHSKEQDKTPFSGKTNLNQHNQLSNQTITIQSQSLHSKQIQTEVPFPQQNILITFHPAVNRLINLLSKFPVNIQDPFKKELQQIKIDSKQVKKIRVNKGKDIYKGQIDEYGKISGLGMIVKQNGTTVMGKFQNGLIQGDSFIFFTDGSYYKGKMKDSLAHDTQGFFYSQNFTYKGGFQNNLFHGKGKEKGPNHQFQGIYEYNLRKSGTLAWQLKKIAQSKLTPEDQIQKLSQIEISNLSKSDAGKLTKSEPQFVKDYKFVYEGNFDVHQLFTRKGKLKEPQGVYIGDFLSGMKHGKGQYVYVDQLWYFGEYLNNNKSGFGILYNCDQTIAYEGQWRNGLPHGRGFSYDLNGKRTEGNFIDGINENILPDSQLENDS